MLQIDNNDYYVPLNSYEDEEEDFDNKCVNKLHKKNNINTVDKQALYNSNMIEKFFEENSYISNTTTNKYLKIIFSFLLIIPIFKIIFAGKHIIRFI